MVDSDIENANVFVDFDEEIEMKDASIIVGMKFTNGHVFRKVLREWSIGKDIVMSW